MKLSLICLAACVAVSMGQNYYWPFSPMSFYRSLFNDIYDDPVMMEPVEQRNALLPYDYRDHHQPGDAMPRMRAKAEYPGAAAPRFALGNRLTPDDRARLFFNFFSFSSFFTQPQSTTYMTTTTVTAVSITTCIPRSQFAGPAGNAPAGGIVELSTGPCAMRKRRGIEIPMDWDDDLIIDPSPVDDLVPSEIARMKSIERTARRAVLLQSSQNEAALEADDDEPRTSSHNRQKRFFGLFNTYTVSISTSFSFTTTGLLVTVTRGTTSALVCLPSGFLVC